MSDPLPFSRWMRLPALTTAGRRRCIEAWLGAAEQLGDPSLDAELRAARAVLLTLAAEEARAAEARAVTRGARAQGLRVPRDALRDAERALAPLEAALRALAEAPGASLAQMRARAAADVLPPPSRRGDGLAARVARLSATRDVLRGPMGREAVEGLGLGAAAAQWECALDAVLDAMERRGTAEGARLPPAALAQHRALGQEAFARAVAAVLLYAGAPGAAWLQQMDGLARKRPRRARARAAAESEPQP